jgi:hypothetical protein
VNIEVGDGSVRRLGLGDVRIAENLIGQGHVTREVGPEPRLSLFVPLGRAIPRRGGLFHWVPIRTRPD